MTERDKTKIDFNPLDDQNPFDLVRVFNENRIITHEYTPAGNKRVQYDAFANAWIEDDPQIVTDNLGNVVVI